MVFYCVMFIFMCVLGFVLACITEMYSSERAKKKASADVKAEASLKSKSVNSRVHRRNCGFISSCKELEKAG